MEYSPTDQAGVHGTTAAAATTTTTSVFTPATSTMSPATAPPEAMGMKTMKVLVAIDESEVSLYALRWALDNLFSVAVGATRPSITILHVLQPFQHYVYPAGPAIFASTPIFETVRKAQQENAASLLARALEVCRSRPVNVQTVIMEGDPKNMICEAVDKIHYDLLILGSRNLSKIKRAFLGSVSDYCAHHADCPTLIVKPPK